MKELLLEPAIARLRMFAGIVLVGIFVGFLPGEAQAFVGNNIRCTRSAGPDNIQRLGAVTPGQTIFFTITLDCTVLRRFPVGAGISYTSQHITGPEVIAGVNGTELPEGGLGTSGTTCLPSSCMTLPVGYRFSSAFPVLTTAATLPGQHYFQYSFFVTSVRGWENYSESIFSGLVFYSVESPACTLVSPRAANLYFGTLSSTDLSEASQQADISVSCRSAVRASAKLTPSQSIVNSAGGVSATTLAGLSMASTWADTGVAINFGSARTLNLQSGNNTLGIRFQPRLNGSSVQAVGNFSSQYTLTITYL
nr:fimbrial protein [uncultured Pseudomonas sp.]